MCLHACKWMKGKSRKEEGKLFHSKRHGDRLDFHPLKVKLSFFFARQQQIFMFVLNCVLKYKQKTAQWSAVTVIWLQ